MEWRGATPKCKTVAANTGRTALVPGRDDVIVRPVTEHHLGNRSTSGAERETLDDRGEQEAKLSFVSDFICGRRGSWTYALYSRGRPRQHR
jgi:hypothetical protein